MTVRFHPVCEAFPLIDENELGELTADIRKNGLREPIWRTRDGAIIDGKNRYLACTRASIAPNYRTYEGADSSLPAFVVSLNMRRRHMNEAARAMAAARLANIPLGGNQHTERVRKSAQAPAVTQKQAADLLKVGRRTVQQARVVQEKGVPELVQAVDKGEIAVSTAAAVANLPKEKQKEAITKAARHPIHRKRHAPRVDRIVAGVVTALEGVCASIDGLQPDGIDKAKAAEWSASIVTLTGEIRRFARRLI